MMLIGFCRDRKAKELLDNGKIAARLSELKAEHVERRAYLDAKNRAAGTNG